jgi:RND family efflux transporter MFP subunit
MIRRLLSLCYLGSGLLLVGCIHKPPPAAPQVPEVSVALPIERRVTDYEDFTGRTDAVYTVDVRARVNGYLAKVYFKDGDLVKKDDVLYLIDPRPYQADLDKAKGQVERLEGQKKLLEVQVDRYTKLVKKGAASQQDLDVYIGQQAENTGSLVAAKAQVIYSQLYLDFCTVKAPIDGQISRAYVQIGNVVNADQTLLTTLVSTDPMYAYFSVEEPTYLRVQKMLTAGEVGRPKGLKVRMGLADDFNRTFPLTGTLDFFNNIIDPLTGTITVRGVFPNPKLILKPGLFTRVRVPIGAAHDTLLVSERAVGSDQGQKFLYTLDAANKVQYRKVDVGLVFDSLRAIEKGLEKDERVVVNGLQRVRPGMEVKPELVKMADQPPAGGEPRPTTVKSGDSNK